MTGAGPPAPALVHTPVLAARTEGDAGLRTAPCRNKYRMTSPDYDMVVHLPPGTGGPVPESRSNGEQVFHSPLGHGGGATCEVEEDYAGR